MIIEDSEKYKKAFESSCNFFNNVKLTESLCGIIIIFDYITLNHCIKTEKNLKQS